MPHFPRSVWLRALIAAPLVVLYAWGMVLFIVLAFGP